MALNCPFEFMGAIVQNILAFLVEIKEGRH